MRTTNEKNKNSKEHEKKQSNFKQKLKDIFAKYKHEVSDQTPSPGKGV